MTPRTIALTGARGGHGTTTVAAALALFAARHGSTVLLADDPTSSAALLGVVHAPADAGLQVTENLVLTSCPVSSLRTSFTNCRSGSGFFGANGNELISIASVVAGFTSQSR